MRYKIYYSILFAACVLFFTLDFLARKWWNVGIDSFLGIVTGLALYSCIRESK